jgi:glycine/sarcosine N-methyltransferase
LSRVPLYDALAGDYDRFVDWKGRLAHELPFLDRLFAGWGVERVLDAACGTGHHAIALSQRGYKVIGADLSTAMVERARENAAAASLNIQFTVTGLGEHAALGEAFDAVLCLGNSLPHLLTRAAVEGALADFASVLRPGGLLVIQNRNFDRVWAERERFMPPQSHRDGEGEWLFVRFYDFHQETVTFHMIRLRRSEEGWTQDVESTELRPIFRDDLAAALAAAGFDRKAFYGGYDGLPFDPARSGDLILVAERN